MFKQKISEEVWGGESGKYRLRDADGNPIDQTPEDTCMRVASALADIEPKDKEYWRDEFFRILKENKFSGGGRIMANVGSGFFKKSTSPINCTVLRQIPDSMEGIMQTAKEAAVTLKAGCGVGYDFSSIRPKGAYVYGAGAATSGVISFMKIFDATCSTVMSGGGRRGAQMGCLDIQHPEVETFISCKRQDGMLRYFNLSVLITEKFMNAVLNDENWNLWFWEKTEKKIDNFKIIEKDDLPFNHSEYDYFKFAEDHTEVVFGNATVDTLFRKKIFKTLSAKELFDIIMKSNYEFAEPGFILIDRVNKENNLWFVENIRATNPCVAEGTLVNTPLGYRKVEDIKEGDLISTLLGSEPVESIEVHEKCPVFKVTFSDGGEQIVTAAHRYHSIKRGSVNKKVQRLRLDELEVGDYVQVFSSKLEPKFNYDQHDEYKKGLMTGILLGDGCYTKKVLNATKNGVVKIATSQDDEEYNNNIKNLFGEISVIGEDDLSKSSKSMSISLLEGKKLVEYLGLEPAYSHEKYFDILKVKTTEFAIGILDGLLATGGNINLSSNHPQIRFMTSSPKLASLIRNLLLLVGAHGRITTSFEKGGVINGKEIIRKHKKHTINVSGGSLKDFLSHSNISKIHPKKGALAKDVLTKFICSGNSWKAEIKSIEPVGEAKVYDLYCKESDTWITEGYVQQGCGEQPLSPDASCLLGSMILPPYVLNPFASNSKFDWQSFKRDIAFASRAMDNVVEINNLPLDSMKDQIMIKRRHGLGFTGLGTIFNMMGMKYGSKESIDLADKIALTIAQESLITNIELAKEKGPAPIFQAEESRKLVMESGYMKRLIPTFKNADQIRAQIMEYGLRYSHATSIAPTGTMSLTWGNNCSNGIEPSFSNSYMRNVRIPGKKTKVQEEVFSYEYLLWKELYGDKELPNYWSTTDNLSVDDHINIQAAVQKWVDSAVSKTVNVPTDYPFEDFKEVYIKGWRSGLKGVTTFRFNPEAFSGVLVRKEDLEQTKYVFTLEDGSEVEVHGTDEIEYDGELHNAANLFDALKEGMYGDM